MVVIFAEVLVLITCAQGEPEVHKLIRQLGSEDLERREFASWALGRMGNAAIPDLKTAATLRDSETGFRAAAVLSYLEQRIESPGLNELIEMFSHVERNDGESAKVERLALELLPTRGRNSRITGLVRFHSADGLRVVLTEAFASTMTLRFGHTYQVHILDRKGATLGTTYVSPSDTQRDINRWSIVQVPDFAELLLRADVSKIKVKATQSEEHRRYYAIRKGTLVLVRYETAVGKPLRDLYPYPGYPLRTAKEWIDILGSDDAAYRLEALAWLGGPHPGSRAYSVPDLANAEASIAEEVREASQDLLNGLRLSSSAWEREAAEMASRSACQSDH